MDKGLIELIDLFRIVFGILFAFFAGYVLENDFKLAFLLLLVGIGFLSFHITPVEKKEEST